VGGSYLCRMGWDRNYPGPNDDQRILSLVVVQIWNEGYVLNEKLINDIQRVEIVTISIKR